MSGDGFLTRWSRRKRGEALEETPAQDVPRADAPPQPTAEAPLADTPPVEGAAADDTLSEDELAALPPIETIDASTDIAAFMRKGVPNALRNAALRRFWAASPLSRDYLDPARDYAYDWNVPGGVPGDGPLAPGFDAKALADRLFGERRPTMAEAAETAEDVRETPEPSAQSAQHNDDAFEPSADLTDDAPPSAPAQTQAELDLSPPAEPRSAPETADFRARPRRHGRATPV